MRHAPEKYESRPDEAVALSAQGFSRIPLPTAFPIPPINVILVQGPEGNALIDTGMEAQDSLLRLEIALQWRGLRWTDLNAVYFTHPHLDHFGLAAELAQRSGATLHAWQPSAHRFENRHEHFAQEQAAYEVWLSEGGFAGADYPRPTYNIDSLKAPTITGFVPLGEEFSLVGHRAQAFHVPGHSPWCIAYWFPEARFLVSGDFLLEHISPNSIVYPAEAADPDWQGLTVYRRSLSSVEHLPVERVIPGHGHTFSDSQKAIGMIRLHQEQRRKRVSQRLQEEGSMTLHELGLALFGTRPLQSSLYLVFSELYRHVEWLEQDNLVEVSHHNGLRHIQWR